MVQVGWHQILAFELLFPCLNPDGGVYMIEDLAEGPCKEVSTQGLSPCYRTTDVQLRTEYVRLS